MRESTKLLVEDPDVQPVRPQRKLRVIFVTALAGAIAFQAGYMSVGYLGKSMVGDVQGEAPVEGAEKADGNNNCVPGKYVSSTYNEGCGKGCTRTKKMCETCPAGQFNSDTNSNCKNCPNGQFAVNSGSISCSANTGKSKLSICLFLHGAMVNGARPTAWKSNYGDVAGALKTYWGDYNHWYADVCESFIYGWAETTSYPWDDQGLMNDYADKAAEVISKGGIVFGHSMANAILAGACHKLGKCVQWYSLGGGYSGQAVGDAAIKLLDEAQSGAAAVSAYASTTLDGQILKSWNPPTFIWDAISKSVRFFVNDKVFKGFSYRNADMRLGPNKNAMARKVDSMGLLKGSLCGVSAVGTQITPTKSDIDDIFKNVLTLATSQPNAFEGLARTLDNLETYKMSIAMQVVAKLVADELVATKHFDTRSDGLVETNACAYWTDDVTTDKGRNWYGIRKEWPEYGPSDTPLPQDTHILARINHIEECGVFPTGGSAVALKWMRNMMCREIEAKGGKCAAWGGKETIAYAFAAPSGQIGDSCQAIGPYACKGVNLNPTQPGTWCCQTNFLDAKFMCQNRVKDYAGVYYCPRDCVGNPGRPVSNMFGSCEQPDRVHWPRWKDEVCAVHTDCQDWDKMDNGRACCNGRCTDKKKDWAGTWWCPNECTGRPFGPKGSC